MPGRKRTEILSCVAQQYSNKELKEHFKYSYSKGEEISCTDYEITRAKMHAKYMDQELSALRLIAHQGTN